MIVVFLSQNAGVYQIRPANNVHARLTTEIHISVMNEAERRDKFEFVLSSSSVGFVNHSKKIMFCILSVCYCYKNQFLPSLSSEVLQENE